MVAHGSPLAPKHGSQRTIKKPITVNNRQKCIYLLPYGARKRCSCAAVCTPLNDSNIIITMYSFAVAAAADAAGKDDVPRRCTIMTELRLAECTSQPTRTLL